METQIIQEIKEIDLKLQEIYRKLDIVEHFGTYELMSDEEERINQEINKLRTSKQKQYYKLYEEKKKLFLNKLNNPEIGEILRINYEATNHKFHQTIDYEFNYLFLNLVEKAPIILEDKEATSIIYSYITSNHYFVSPQNDKTIELLKLEARLLQSKEFLLIINNVAFDFVKEVFYTPELVNNAAFIAYFIKFIKQEWKYGDFYFPKEMVQGLNAYINYDLVISLGNEENLKRYISKHIGEKFLSKMSKIKSKSLGKCVLQYISKLRTNNYNILKQFLQFPEIKEQLLDQTSLYYHLLINSWYLIDENYKYGSKENLFQFRSNDIFCEFDFEQMVHYFDSLIKGHYIYFCEKGKVCQVPLLAYIKNCRKKLELYYYTIDTVYSADNTRNEIHKLEKKYHNILKYSFKDLCIQALAESVGETLSQEQIDEWNYLLRIAPSGIEADKFSKIKIKKD